jgi:hypothetical protein
MQGNELVMFLPLMKGEARWGLEIRKNIRTTLPYPSLYKGGESET